ncbi:unnamed protein product [Phyllotreta striolata]|uniref:Protein amnionless n=1 Tax=Phyllotreta striolata TaxID=444603 RepID=A0A9N9XMN5_PHYSR|nr:unnamed protein product [Phyllotreta striolata]
MWLKIIFTITWGTVCHGALFTFNKSYDIYDRNNWENRRLGKTCRGLVMPKWPHGVITAQKLELKQLIFGYNMDFLFKDDTEITFNEHSTSTFNCVTLNSTEMAPHHWDDPTNWILEDRLDNAAVPDLEKLPGRHDDVFLPKGILSGRIYVPGPLEVNMLLFGEERWPGFTLTNDDTVAEVLDMLNGQLSVDGGVCSDRSGCPSGNEEAYRDMCRFVDERDTFDCEDPIEAIGFCNKICGAAIRFSPKADFDIRSLRTELDGFESETHASKVKTQDGDEVVQIVFAESKFTGNSLVEAKTLYDRLVAGGRISPGVSGTISSSGYRYEEGATVESAMSAVFGCLAGVCLLFGLLYFVFDDDKRLKSLRERTGLGQGPLTYRSVLFTRHLSVSEGAGLILDGQSAAGSLQDLRPTPGNSPQKSVRIEPKKKSPSTSEASDSSDEGGTDAIANESSNRELFEEQERRNLIETVAEEGELVDLSELN